MDTKLNKVFKYIFDHKNEFLDDFRNIIKIPTVAVQKEHKQDLQKALEFIKNMLQKAGVENIKIFDKYEKPMIFGEKIIDKNYKTILLYAHYDVQPVDPFNLWDTDPFDLVIKGDKMYGRGVSDDKGLVITTIKAVESLLKTNNLKCNVKFIFEGGEESGSTDFIKLIQQPKEVTEFLQNDVTLVCDTSMGNANNPNIYVSVRGIIAFEITVIGANRDLHSGVYGGEVGNPIHALSSIISSFHDKDNHIIIDDFYKGVKEMTIEDHKDCFTLELKEKQDKEDLQIKDLVVEKGYTVNEVIGFRPTIEVNGIYGGYTGEGGKTVIPSSATAKITCRLVDEQKPQYIFECIKKHVNKFLPSGFKVKIEMNKGEGGQAFKVKKDSNDFKKYCEAIEKEFGKYPTYKYAGGSIGVVSYLKQFLNDNIIFVGFSEDDSHEHSPNECFKVANFEKGIKTLVRFIDSYGQ